MGKGKTAHNGALYLGLGAFLGLVADFVYQSQGIVGYNQKLPVCPALTTGDVMQLGGLAFINAGATFANHFTLSAITAGMMLGNVAPKLMSVIGKPRYIIYDYNPATSGLTPAGGGLKGVLGGNTQAHK